jgi:hypothetical protein
VKDQAASEVAPLISQSIFNTSYDVQLLDAKFESIDCQSSNKRLIYTKTGALLNRPSLVNRPNEFPIF